MSCRHSRFLKSACIVALHSCLLVRGHGAPAVDAMAREFAKANLMGHAITRDPKLETWEILTTDKPLIGISENAIDGVENTMVFKTGDHWTMIYSEGLAKQHLAIATSKDLREWKLEGPIAIGKQPWMARRFGAPFVWQEDSRWMMILMGTSEVDRTTFGLLTSPDGKTWTLLAQ